jgi:ApaG protein
VELLAQPGEPAGGDVLLLHAFFSCPKRGVLATFPRVSVAVTQGIRITVKSRFLPEQSSAGRWAFAYTVRIENIGSITAQLRSRHWIITDGNGKREEVKGDGVVGNQPTLRPGEKFEYTSGAILQTPHGSMQGTYRMVTEDGRQFDAEIAAFPLTQPGSLN